jgi:hypothetical protein
MFQQVIDGIIKKGIDKSLSAGVTPIELWFSVSPE